MTHTNRWVTRFYALTHFGVGKWGFAVDASLGGKAAVGFDDQFRRNTSGALETVDILCEEHSQELFLGEKRDECV
jgi:hypothetical protein